MWLFGACNRSIIDCGKVLPFWFSMPVWSRAQLRMSQTLNSSIFSPDLRHFTMFPQTTRVLKGSQLIEPFALCALREQGLIESAEDSAFSPQDARRIIRAPSRERHWPFSGLNSRNDYSYHSHGAASTPLKLNNTYKSWLKVISCSCLLFWTRPETFGIYRFSPPLFSTFYWHPVYLLGVDSCVLLPVQINNVPGSERKGKEMIPPTRPKNISCGSWCKAVWALILSCHKQAKGM